MEGKLLSKSSLFLFFFLNHW